jgi:hypothetical protein
MFPLTALWLPILVSAVLIFIASNILWMVLKFWHYKDYQRVPDDKVFVDATRALKGGMYVFPFMDWKTMTPEQKAEATKGPMGFMILRNPAAFSFGKTLGIYFLYCLFSAFCAAYIGHETLAAGTDYLRVFQITGAVGTFFWAFGTNISDAIWYGKPWSVAFKHVIDGLIFGCLIGGTFGWLWPK